MASPLYVACVFAILYFTFPGAFSHHHLTCFNQTVNSIPSDHACVKMKKPLVLGHHGNPSEYQENTLDGFKSLLKTNADGFLADVYLTKDEQLVVFHFDNTLKMTGASHDIWDTTYEDLLKLDLKKELTYETKVFKYDKTGKIPLLSEVIDAMKGTGLLMQFFIKPGYTRDLSESEKVGRAVAKLVTDKGVAHQVLIASYDPFKVLFVKKQNPSLVVGMFYNTGMWSENTANKMKNVMGGLPGMRDCVMEAPNGTEFMNFLFTNGAMLKSTNSTFLDMDYNIFNNPMYSANDTFKTFKENYSPTFNFGAWNIYKMSLTDAQKDANDKVVDLLVNNAVDRLTTDNVTRLLTKLGRSTTRPTAKPQPTALAARHSAPVFVIYTFLLLAWLLR